jgi:hypothetical protein
MHGTNSNQAAGARRTYETPFASVVSRTPTCKCRTVFRRRQGARTSVTTDPGLRSHGAPWYYVICFAGSVQLGVAALRRADSDTFFYLCSKGRQRHFLLPLFEGPTPTLSSTFVRRADSNTFLYLCSKGRQRYFPLPLFEE